MSFSSWLQAPFKNIDNVPISVPNDPRKINERGKVTLTASASATHSMVDVE